MRIRLATKSLSSVVPDGPEHVVAYPIQGTVRTIALPVRSDERPTFQIYQDGPFASITAVQLTPLQAMEAAAYAVYASELLRAEGSASQINFMEFSYEDGSRRYAVMFDQLSDPTT